MKYLPYILGAYGLVGSTISVLLFGGGGLFAFFFCNIVAIIFGMVGEAINDYFKR